MNKNNFYLFGLGLAGLALQNCKEPENKSPNLLFIISDDQSWLHAGCYGDEIVKTPNIDKLASEGVRFTQAYCAAPSCSPSRASILTGQQVWRLEQGANLWSRFPENKSTYTDLLQDEGFHVGCSEKGWKPGLEPDTLLNPAGDVYTDFIDFRKANADNKPWCYWYGSYDPHRPYDIGSGERYGMDIENIKVPSVMPDNEITKNDIADYYLEIQRFDSVIGSILNTLEEAGEMENTIIVITSDNGMPFPRAKATLYDLGTRIPLIISWKNKFPGNRIVDDFVSLTDIAPTFLEAAGLEIPEKMTGKSLMNILYSAKSGGRIDLSRDYIVTARERHSWARAGGLSYPSRALRTYEYLYIRNFEPDRWPAGDPPLYSDIDDHQFGSYSPTKEYMIIHQHDVNIKPLFELGFGKRPAEELYDLAKDPDQMNNVADNEKYKDIKARLSKQLEDYLTETNDVRVTNPEKAILWDTCKYYGSSVVKYPRKEAREKFGLDSVITF